MPHTRKLIVTHHAPDIDAVGAVWMLKRFDAEIYADAKVAFVNPGDRISYDEAKRLGAEPYQVTHVDTGKGRFDHHKEERGKLAISATSLTYDYVCSLDPNLKNNEALGIISSFVNEIDHFQEVSWPEADSYRYCFMLYELIRGFELINPHDDDSQLHFGMTCMDIAYSVVTQHVKAEESITENGQEFEINGQKCLAIESRNDGTIKLAQKKGYDLVIRRDPKEGTIRIKARPDSDIDLSKLSELILSKDEVGKWYLHPSKKMLLNGSNKDRDSKPSKLQLAEVIKLAEQYVE